MFINKFQYVYTKWEHKWPWWKPHLQIRVHHMTFNINKQKNLLIFCNELDYCGNETTKKELGKKC